MSNRNLEIEAVLLARFVGAQLLIDAARELAVCSLWRDVLGAGFYCTQCSSRLDDDTTGHADGCKVCNVLRAANAFETALTLPGIHPLEGSTERRVEYFPVVHPTETELA